MAKARRVLGSGSGVMDLRGRVERFVRAHRRTVGLAVLLGLLALLAGKLVSSVVLDLVGAMLPPQVPTDHRTVAERIPGYIGLFSFGAAALATFVLGWSYLHREP